MLVVALNGSPQKKGNTSTLLEAALEGARRQKARTELVHISEILKDLKVPFCNQCSTPCEGACSKDNRLGEVFDLLRKADGLLIGSPVYFGTVSGQLKAFWDKTRILRKEKALLNVPGGALSVGAARFGGQENTLNAIFQMMLVQGMTVVGDGFYLEDCGHFGSCAQKPAEEDTKGLERARILGQRVAESAVTLSDLRHRS